MFRLHVCTCTCEPSALGGQEVASEPPNWSWWVAVNQPVHARTRTPALSPAESAPQPLCSTLPLLPCFRCFQAPSHCEFNSFVFLVNRFTFPHVSPGVYTQALKFVASAFLHCAVSLAIATLTRPRLSPLWAQNLRICSCTRSTIELRPHLRTLLKMFLFAVCTYQVP